MIYLDNAATTRYKPKRVIQAAVNCMTETSFNFNRSGHAGANALAARIALVRQKVVNFVNADSPSNVVFCNNCTHALNIAILGRVKRGGHVISSVNEHNSVLRPLCELARRGIVELTLITPKGNSIGADEVAEHIRKNTYMVVLQYVSNVTGQTNDIESIGLMLKKRNIDFLVDAAQAVGYLPLDMRAQGITHLAFPCHKGLHGLQGSGILVFDGNRRPSPIMYGGTGSDSANLSQPDFSPDCFEVGTLNAPAFVALGEAIDWFDETKHVNLPQIMILQNFLQEQLNSVKDVKVYSVRNASGIVSFSVGGFESGEVGDLLSAEYDIATRCGLHCAPLIHKRLGTEHGGLIRVSFSGENTKNDCFALLTAIERITKRK